ncbi:MAG: M6 family metalloprotease domain-containing protein [Thermoplasmatales archaeon]|nr:M6 family metalloprotease domain-containing protein [Thermoplasmatales archaeon]
MYRASRKIVAKLFFVLFATVVMLLVSGIISAGIIQLSEGEGKPNSFEQMPAWRDISKDTNTGSYDITTSSDNREKPLSYTRNIFSEPSPIPFVLSQPDGSTFQARIVGDKFGWHLESIDGFTIMQDNLGRWAYAKEDNGKIVHSEFIVGSTTGSKLSGIKKHLIPNDRELLTRSLPQLKKAAGVGKIVVIMLQFTNVQFTPTHTKEYYSNMLFSTTNNSMRKFYRENSYNTYDITGDIVGPFTSAYTMEYYGDDSVDWQGIDNANGSIYEMAREAVQLADATVDFSEYDTDGDGYVDNLIVIHAGPDQAAGGGAYGSNAIWSHQWYIYPAPGELVDGVYAFTYGTDPEDGQIGVFCHEFGHQIGLPDLYDIDYSSVGVGDWSLMAGGGFLGPSRDGTNPAHFDAWCKIQLGWITPTEIQSNATGVTINAVETNPQAYKIMINTPNEYFLIENRNKNAGNYDKYLPGEGLLIYHIDESKQSNSDETHRLVDVEEAHGGVQNLDYPSGNPNSNSGDANDPWKNSVAGFSDFSDPNAIAYGKTRTGIAIKNIGSAGAAMTFDFTVMFPTQTSQEIIIYCKEKTDVFGTELRTMSQDGTNDKLLFDGVIPEGYLVPMWPRYSMDGEEIVFSALKGEYWQIWTMDSDAKNLFRVFNASAYGTFPGAPVYSPSFSYDKQKVAFVFDPVDSDAFLVVSYSNGSYFWRITAGGSWCVYSPTNYSIAGEGYEIGYIGSSICLTNGDTPEYPPGVSYSVLLYPNQDVYYNYGYTDWLRPLDWSPDGTKILFREWLWPYWGTSAAGYYALWTLDVATGDYQPVFGWNSTEGYTNLDNVILQASFSSDGTKVVFDLSDGLTADGIAGKDFDIYTINVNGTGLTKITNDKKSAMPYWCKQPYIPQPGKVAGYAYHKDLTNPIVGANVVLNPGGYITATDSNGYYSVASVPAGRYTVAISKGGYSTTSSSVAVAGASVAISALYLDVTNPGTINGNVYIAGTSTPIANALVATTRGDYNTTTTSSGGFTISSVAPNPYNITANASGHRYQSSSVTVSAGGTATCNLYLSPVQTANWTYIVYLDGDNNLWEAGDSDYQELQSVGSTDNVNIVVLKDNDRFGDTKLIVPNIGGTTSTEIPLRYINPSFGIELDMGSYQTLSNFVLWTIEKYPAQHYALDLWDHGGGYTGMCWDDISGTHITVPDLRNVMITITNKLGKPVDVLVHSSCLMGELEADYNIKAYADFIVHSEEIMPWDGIPYHSQYGGDVLGRLKTSPEWTAEQFAVDIVDQYSIRYAGGDGTETLSAVNTTLLDDKLVLAVNNFAQKLKHVTNTYWTQINSSMYQAETYSSQELIDLYDFASRIKTNIVNTEIQQAAQWVMDNISSCVIAEWHGNNHPNSYGLTIFFPWSYNAYTQRVSDYSPLYMTIESKWNDFLQAFYNKQDYPNTEPECNITTPSNNEIICQGAVVTVSGTAYDEDGINKVQIKIDRGDWIDAVGTTAWSYDWDTIGMSEGYHRIYARALDNKALDIAKDYSWYQFVFVNVIKNLPPEITYYYPLFDPTINETESITFNITAIDPEGKTLTYQWYKNGTLITGATGISYTFSTDYDSSGVYNITVVISDDYVSISHTWILEVRNKNRKPVISYAYPEGEEITLNEGQSIIFNITAYDPDSTALIIEWKLNGIIVCSNNISYTFNAEPSSLELNIVNITITDGEDSVYYQWVVRVNLKPLAVSLSAPSTTTTTITLAWTQSQISDFANYTIYQSEIQGVLGNPIAVIQQNSTTYHTVTKLGLNTTYYFIVRVYDDGNLYNDSNQLAVKTLAVNHPPQITSFSPLTDKTINESEAITFNVNASDPDGTTPTVEWRVNGVLVATGNSYTFTANYTSSGVYTVNVTITDGEYYVYHQWLLTVAEVSVIGTSGGTVSYENITVQIPTNAVPGNTSITITPTSVTPPSGFGVVGKAYKIETPLQTFTQQITITLSYTEPLPEGVSEDDLAIWRKVGDSWEKLGGTVNKEKNIISVEVESLSDYAILYEIKGVDKGVEKPTEIPWVLIGGIISAVAVIIVVVLVMLRRRIPAGRRIPVPREEPVREEMPVREEIAPEKPVSGKRFCIKCGREISKTAGFCPYCGYRFKK